MPDAPYSLLAELEKVKDLDRPPIHLWHPDNVKDIDMEIQRDGSWHYMGTPIGRQRLVRLFATVLRREDDGAYYLVTPVEKCRIRVADVPFMAILLDISGAGSDAVLTFTTNMAEQVVADDAHPIRVSIDPETGEPSPYIMVRDGLEARIARSVYYDLVGELVTHTVDGSEWDGVWSKGSFFPFIASAEMR